MVEVMKKYTKKLKRYHPKGYTIIEFCDGKKILIKSGTQDIDINSTTFYNFYTRTYYAGNLFRSWEFYGENSTMEVPRGSIQSIIYR
jgi:hypothetical protein